MAPAQCPEVILNSQLEHCHEGFVLSFVAMSVTPRGILLEQRMVREEDRCDRPPEQFYVYLYHSFLDSIPI